MFFKSIAGCKSLAYLAALAVMSLVAMVPAAHARDGKGAVAKGETLRIQTFPGTVGAGMSLLWVAEEKGFCTAHGIKCQPVDIPNGALGLQALASGSIEIAMASTDVAMQAAARGADVQLIAGAHPGGIFSLLARKDLALPNKEKGYPSVMQDLKGLKVGTAARGSSTEIWTRALLEGAGMKASDVTFVAVGGPATAYQAMALKQIDIVMSWEPFQTICAAQKTCTTVLELRDPKVGPPEIRALHGAFEQYSARSRFVKENKPAIDAFIAAIRDASVWAKNPANFEELYQMAKKRVKFSEIQDGDQLLRDLLAREVRALDIYLDRSAVQANAAFLLKSGLISKAFDTKDFVYEGAPAPGK